MAGIVFYRTPNRETVVDFYIDRLGFERWLEQDAGCTILQYDSLLVGFCDGETVQNDGIITLVESSADAVDARYDSLADLAEAPPTDNETFDIYHCFLKDPDGRTVEIQTFRHATPPV